MLPNDVNSFALIGFNRVIVADRRRRLSHYLLVDSFDLQLRSIVRDRESGPIRLLRGDFPQETVEIPDQGFASVVEQKGLSGKGWRTSWKQKSISVFAAFVLF